MVSWSSSWVSTESCRHEILVPFTVLLMCLLSPNLAFALCRLLLNQTTNPLLSIWISLHLQGSLACFHRHTSMLYNTQTGLSYTSEPGRSYLSEKLPTISLSDIQCTLFRKYVRIEWSHPSRRGHLTIRVLLSHSLCSYLRLWWRLSNTPSPREVDVGSPKLCNGSGLFVRRLASFWWLRFEISREYQLETLHSTKSTCRGSN